MLIQTGDKRVDRGIRFRRILNLRIVTAIRNDFDA